MKKPVTDMLSVLGGDLGSRAVGFLVTLYLARVLAPSSFGIINIGVAVLSYLTLLGSPGIQIVETRNAAATEGGIPGRAGAVLLMRLALAPLLIALTYAVLLWMNVPSTLRAVIGLYSLSLIPLALSLDWHFQGKEDFRHVMISRLLGALVFACVLVLIVRSESQIALTPVAYLTGNAAAAVFLGLLYRRRFGLPELRWNPSTWWRVYRDNVAAGTAVFLAQSVSNLPPIVIGIFLSYADAGMYAAGMKLVFLLLIVDRTLNALFLPLATRYAVGRKEEFPRLLSALLLAIVVLMLPVLIGACIIAEPAVRIIFGPGYGGAVPVLRVLTGYVLVTMFNSSFVCALVAFGRTQTYARIVIGGAAIVSAGVIAATLLLGAVGAGVGIIAGEVVMLVMLVRAAGRVFPLPSFRPLLRPLFAGLAMAASGVALATQPPPVSLVASLALFALLLFAMKVVPGGEFRYLRERLI